MTLIETSMTIERWIISCDNSAQLDLLLEVISNFVTPERLLDADEWDIVAAKTVLLENVQAKRLTLTQSKATPQYEETDEFIKDLKAV